MKELTVKLHEVAVDGLPDMARLTGRVAFLFDGCVVSGWPLDETGADGLVLWEANSDVSLVASFGGVTHWLEFPVPVHALEVPRP